MPRSGAPARASIADDAGSDTIAPSLPANGALATSVKRYYRENQFFYDWFWTDAASRSMNYGIWTPGTYTLRQAFANQNGLIAETLAVHARDSVLEAGCGCGGATVWIARRYGNQGTGITLCRHQARRGAALARTMRVADRVSFAVSDFTRSGFADGSFSAMFASESACYAWDKGDFIAEAHRLLRPGGRLVVIDGFEPRSLSPTKRRILDDWAAGWAVPRLAGFEGFEQALRETGFRDVSFVDLTPRIMPSARRILARGLAAYPLARMAGVIAALTPAQVAHVRSSITQYAVWSRIGIYGMFSATRG